MERFRTLEPMQFKGNIVENWKFWKQKLDIFLTATKISKDKDEVKVATMLNAIGDEGLKIYNSLDFAQPSDSVVYDRVIEKMEQYCTPRKNTVFERYKFYSRNQLQMENIDQYYTVLKTMVQDCEFAETETMIRDKIILGTRYIEVQQRMLREPDIGLDKALDFCRVFETSRMQFKEIRQDETIVVDAVYQKSKDNLYQSKQNKDKLKFYEKTAGKKCMKCGAQHEYGKCKAYGKKCRKCSKLNHYEKMCRSEQGKTTRFKPAVHTLDEQDLDAVWTIVKEGGKSTWLENFKINKTDVLMRIDSGSDVNILTYQIAKKLVKLSKIEKVKVLPISYTGHTIKVLGVVKLETQLGNTVRELEYMIVNDNGMKSLIGLKAAHEFDLIKPKDTLHVQYIQNVTPEELVQKYKGVFEGLGKLKTAYKIRLEKDAIPKAFPSRKIPLSMQSVVKKELFNMVHDGILKPVEEPTEWVSPIMIKKKPKGGIRICMDPRHLNKYVIREKCWIPTAETIWSEVAGSKFYTVLDASRAFHQVVLDEDSSRLCTIATPYGRFRYTRLPYGLSSAPEVFQQTMSGLLAGLDGVTSYIDDILVHGRTWEEHNHRLEKILQRVQDSGLKLSKEKTQLAVEKIQYLGHVITKQGIQCDPKKIEAVQRMPIPTNKKELQSFIGLMTYIGRYIPALSEKMAPLRQLLSEKNMWEWETGGVYDKVFTELKKMATAAPVLKHFDPEEEVIISVDASSYGLGAVMLQNGSPVAYTSVTLNNTQRNYSQIEKELLAIVHAVEKFNYYTFGRVVRIQTDHKPLLAIVKKPLHMLTPRLQRMVIRLLRYTVILEHVPGKELYVADALSRKPIADKINTNDVDNVKTVCTITFSTNKRKDKMKLETCKDDTLNNVIQYCKMGWPKKMESSNRLLIKFKAIQDELHVQDGLLCRGNRICIPKSLIKDMLEVIHETHQGAWICLKKAKQAMFWFGMSTDIVNMVESCETCQRYAKSNSCESLTPHDVPKYPWSKLAIDFKTHQDKEYLVGIDCFSKYAVIDYMPNKTADVVIDTLEKIFSIFGIPNELYSDSGPPFVSAKFLEFCHDNDIQCSTSSPGHHESNGMIERQIQTVKAMIVKNNGNLKMINRAVLNYNTAPKINTASPSEILMGRKLRTRIPEMEENRKPLYNLDKHIKALEQNRVKMMEHRKERKLPELKEGQEVYYQIDKRKWRPSVITKKLDHNSFQITTGHGTTLRRNRIHLRPKKTIPHIGDRYITEPPTDVTDIVSGKESVESTERPLGYEEHTTPDGRTLTVTRSGRVCKPPIRLDL